MKKNFLIPLKDGLSFAAIYLPIFVGVSYYLGNFSFTYTYLLRVALQVGITAAVFALVKYKFGPDSCTVDLSNGE